MRRRSSRSVLPPTHDAMPGRCRLRISAIISAAFTEAVNTSARRRPMICSEADAICCKFFSASSTAARSPPFRSPAVVRMLE